MPSQKDLRDQFSELTELLILEEGGPATFRVRAYENATETIRSTHEDLSSMSISKLTKLEGIGKSTASKIHEYFQTGSIARLEELREKFPPSFVQLGRIPGLGPKTLLRLRAELAIENLEDLKQAITKERIRALKGMGAKSEEKLAKAIDRIGSKQDRRPIAEALPLAETLVEELGQLAGVEQIQYAGSLRRFRDTISDIDIVVAASTAQPIMDFFVKMDRVVDILSHGETKSSIVTRKGIQVDLRVVQPEHYGAALLYFTGSKAHNIKLRQRAIAQGYTLNEYGLTEVSSNKVLASREEEEIYKKLNMSWIQPPLREDQGEIEAATDRKLPCLVQVTDLKGDLHVHTNYSGDAKGSVSDMVEKAHALHYKYVAITDHGYDLRINGVNEEDHTRIAADIKSIRAAYPHMLILHGCELNIGKEGTLDYSQEQRESFDICIASVHSHFDLDEDSQTKRLIHAMEDPSVRILGHMLGRSIGKREGIHCNVKKVLESALKNHVAIEINSGLTRLDAPAEILRIAYEIGNDFVINSDAHHPDHMEGIRFGVRQSHRGWIPREKVINTWTVEHFSDWLKARSL